jgi:hypothetical protein
MSAMSYMEQFDTYKMLDTKMMDRIMKDYWGSNIDTSGSFLEASTSFNILKSDFTSKDDYEATHRFYHKRDYKSFRPHEFVYKVYVRSMQQRFFFELIAFLVLAVFFQFQIDSFNSGQHELDRDIKTWLNVTANGTYADQP